MVNQICGCDREASAPRCPGGVWAAGGSTWTACGRSLYMKHMDAGELIEHRANCETRRQRVELRSQGDVQAIRHESDEPGLHGCNAFGRYRMKMCASIRRLSGDRSGGWTDRP